MKVAIMQPYFFPYIGYWQLINCVDVFVIFDDVNYIKRGWINRNRILSDKVDYIRIPLEGVSQNKLINEIKIIDNDEFIYNNMAILHETYRKAPHYQLLEKDFENWISINKRSLSEYLTIQIQRICSFLDISTEILISSRINKPDYLKGEEKILWICNKLGADTYINPIGGLELYDANHFRDNNIELKFLKSRLTPYKQFDNEFVPSLSILDVIAFNGIDVTRKMLGDYDLVMS